MIRTPSAFSAVETTAAASISSRGRTCASACTMVTALPNRANDWASSVPTGPPPITINRAGRSVSEKIDSLVSYGVSVRPGIGGRAARAPVAMIARRKRNTVSFTVIASGPQNVAWPKNTSTPSARKRSTPSTGLMSARRRRSRAMTAPKSPSEVTRGPPNRSAAVRASRHARAARITAFEGTQPKLRQSPPNMCRSISATRAPRPAAIAALTRPAVPAPITTR